jgi:RNA polymerase sigma-70 factor (ECF subfamily)
MRQPAPGGSPSKVSERADPDAGLVERCRNGELGAFEELYGRHSGRLYNVACRMLGNAADAEDLVQEAFLQAHRKLETFRGDSALGTWLYRLLVNLCLDYVRSRAGRAAQATASLDEAEAAPARGHRLEHRLPSTRPDPVVERIDLAQAIARLPEGSRAAFVLHEVEGLEHRDVAEILGISEGTSKSQLHKARLRLREMLKGRS